MKRKMSRLLVTLLVALTVMGSSTAFAAEAKTPAAPVVESHDGTVVIMAEETCWYYREWSGGFQKRLWSYTYNKWLTNWIDCVPGPGAAILAE